MSIDSEDSPLEEALRSDLPSDETAARVRRRLLAAGIAVGNGMAVTTAAAGMAPGVLAGAAAKVGALSWGVKVGFAAAIAIPTFGLVAERSLSSEAAQVAPRQAPATLPAQQAQQAATEPYRAAQAPREDDALTAPEPAASPSPAAGALEAKPRAAEPAPGPARPSQLAFDGAEQTSTSKSVSTLAEETRILDAAFAELAAGNEARASELIREHETRFPAGLLGRERERAKTRLHEVSRGE